MTAHAFSADFVTIQAYAWLIEQNLRERFLRQQQEQSWITNSYRHMRQVVLDCLEEMLSDNYFCRRMRMTNQRQLRNQWQRGVYHAALSCQGRSASALT